MTDRDLEATVEAGGRGSEGAAGSAGSSGDSGEARAPSTDPSGRRYGHYRVLRPLGRGGMGEVYLARDMRLDRKVALKFLPESMQKSETAVRRFYREARSAALLDHPYICSIYEVGESRGRHFIAMEYVEGRTLADLLADGPLPLRDALRLATEICEALARAQREGIVHRDLKPSNIMVTPDRHAKVMDFGLAKKVETLAGDTSIDTLSQLTVDGSTPGTLSYMSPEQARGRELDTRSDLFSFGVVLYEMISGVHPFDRQQLVQTVDSLLNKRQEPLSRPDSSVPPALEQIVDRALRKEPDQRYQRASELHEDLSRLVDEVTVGSSTTSSIQVPGRRLLLEIAVVAALLVPVIWLLFVAFGRDGSDEVTPTGSSEGVVGTHWQHSIAVLPFENLTSDPEQDHFCGAVTDQIINNLAQVRHLKVIARTSAMAYAGTEKGARQIGEELGVDNLLEGSIQRQGERIRVNARLIQVADGFPIWAKEYEREMSDIFELQDDLADSIVTALELNLTPREAEAIKTDRAESVEAWESAIKAMYHTHSYYFGFREADFSAALQLGQRAVELDSNYPLGYVALNYAHCFRHFVTRDPEQLGLCKRYSDLAVSLDPEDSMVALTAAGYPMNSGDGAGALKHLRRSVELNPNNALSIGFIGRVLNDFFGRYNEAIPYNDRAIALDPLFPFYWHNRGLSLLKIGEYEAARRDLDKALDLQPLDHEALGFYAELALRMDDLELASSVIGRREAIRPGTSDVYQALLLAKQGRADDALAIESTSVVLAVAGRKNEAVAALREELSSTGRPFYLDLRDSPFYDSLRSMPDFEEVLSEQRTRYREQEPF